MYSIELAARPTASHTHTNFRAPSSHAKRFRNSHNAGRPSVSSLLLLCSAHSSSLPRAIHFFRTHEQEEREETWCAYATAQHVRRIYASMRIIVFRVH